MAKTKRPKPGKPVRGSTTGKPIMALIDLMGRRRVLRILWELRDEPLTFRALQEACGGLSPSVLNTRLAALRETAVIDTEADGYTLTPLGERKSTRTNSSHYCAHWTQHSA